MPDGIRRDASSYLGEYCRSSPVDDYLGEPAWLSRLRPAAKQRPRTQFVKVRWHDLQQLLRERDLLVLRADDETLSALKALDDEYGRD